MLFYNSGQSCVAGSRTYVHESIYEQFIEKTLQHVKALKTGDPFDNSNDLGAIISQEQFDRVMYYIG